MTDREKVIKGLECCVAYDYKCNDCPYQNDGGAEDGCYSDELKAEALALLKAQEHEALDMPKPDSDIGCWYDITHNYTLEQVVSALKAQEPRVMTVDEVGTWISMPRIDREPIWVETENSVNAWIVSDEYWDMQIDVNLSSDLYGKTWRCWTSRPDQATMEAIPWE